MRRHAKVLVAALTLLAVLGVATATADTAPSVTIEAPSEVKFTSARLSGQVNPNAGPSITHWHFEFSKDPVGEGWSQAQDHEMSQAESGESSPIAVQDDLSNLSSNTKYFVRLVASNDGGQGESTEAELETEAVTAPVVTVDDATSVTASSAHFEGTVNPGNSDPAFDSSCAFDYVTETHFQANGFNGAQQVACDVNPVTGTSSTAVQAEPGNLQPNTTYHLRIRAQNQGGTGTALAASTFKTTAVGPIVTQPGSTPLGQGEMGVGAYVKAGNSTITDCHFDYGPTPAYGQSVPCITTPPSDNEAHVASAHLSGLAPGATYHYRLSVTSEVTTVPSEDAILETLEAPSHEACPNAGGPGVGFLPDCRAWEMVSPPEKNGGEVFGKFGRTRAAPDGSALQFSSLAGFGDPPGGSVAVDYLAQRSNSSNPGDNGWESHGITPQQVAVPAAGAAASVEPNYKSAFSTDFTGGIFGAYSPLTDDPNVANAFNLYLRDDLRSSGPGHYRLITACPLCEEPGGKPLPALVSDSPFAALATAPYLAGASPDFSHIVFESTVQLTNDDAPQSETCNEEFFKISFFFYFTCQPHLYEWAHGTVRLAGILPDGTPAGVSVAGQGTHEGQYLTHNVVSDGSDGHGRVFFTSGDEQLYDREDGAVTVHLNASERTDCAGDPTCGGDHVPDPVPDSPGPAYYQDASANGERVFFISAAALTDDAPDFPNNKLYMYDASKPASDPHNLTLLSPDTELSDGFGNPGGVQGMIGASEDGRYVYFVGDGLIKGGPSDFTQGTTIYLWHDGSLTEVGPGPSGEVDKEDLIDNSAQIGGVGRGSQARVSPDGRYLLFAMREGGRLLSARGGIDYSHSAACGGENSGCRELYVYDADTNALACATCNPSDAAATTDASDRPTDGLNGIHSAGAAESTYQSHPLSDDGRYVFFHTQEKLVAEDRDGTTSDAYVYDTTTGKVSLLSSGEAAGGSYFLDASANGKDVFILTPEALSRWDVDQGLDVYDARVDGGFPEPSPPPPSCQGDACQPAPTELNDPTPASSSFSGAGNPAPARKAHKHKRRKAHRTRKHQHKRDAKHNRRAGR